jgi:hypothetical protein
VDPGAPRGTRVPRGTSGYPGYLGVSRCTSGYLGVPRGTIPAPPCPLMQAPLLLRSSAELRATFDNMTIDAHGTNRNTSSRLVFHGGRRFVPQLLVLCFFSCSASDKGVPDNASVVHWTRFGRTRGHFGTLVVVATKRSRIEFPRQEPHQNTQHSEPDAAAGVSGPNSDPTFSILCPPPSPPIQCCGGSFCNGVLCCIANSLFAFPNSASDKRGSR